LLSIKSLLSNGTAFSVHCVLILRWADLAEYRNRILGTLFVPGGKVSKRRRFFLLLLLLLPFPFRLPLVLVWMQ